MALILPNKAGADLSVKAEMAVTKAVQQFFQFDVTGRVTVIADQHHYRTMEDKSVWEQAKGLRPDWFEAYWDGVWCCDFSARATPAQIGIEFMKGFAKAYEAGEVGLHTPKEYQEGIAERMINEEIQKVKDMKIENDVQGIQKQVMTELLEEKKPKRRKK